MRTVLNPVKTLAAGVVFLVTLSSCEQVDELRKLALGIFGKTATQERSLDPEERLRRESSQLLSEMFRVVLLREPVNEMEFQGFLSPLMQGASLEGIYNGFVHSAQYKKMEASRGRAEPATLRVFASEISAIASQEKKPSDLDVTPPLTPEKFEKRFSQASLFTLKRVLGSEVLRLIAEKSASTDALVDWYSDWAVRIAERRIDLGLELRSRADRQFHRDWAVRALETGRIDRINWEALNRAHRLLNQTEEQAVHAAAR